MAERDTNELVAQWEQSLEGPAMVVVEDYHRESAAQITDEILTLAHARDDLTLVLLTRAPAQIGLRALGDPQSFFRLGAEDLGYTAEEIIAEAEECDARLPEEVVQFLGEFSGWPYLVHLAISQAQTIGSDDATRQVEQLSFAVLELAGSRLHGQVVTSVALCEGLDEQFLADFLERPLGQIEEAVVDPLELGLVSSDAMAPTVKYSSPAVLEAGLRRVAELQWSRGEIRSMRRAFAVHLQDEKPCVAADIQLDLGDLVAVESLLGVQFPRILADGLSDYAPGSLGWRLAEVPFVEARQFPLLLGFQMKLRSLNELLPFTCPLEAARRIRELCSRQDIPKGIDPNIAVGVELIAARTLGDQAWLERLVEGAGSALISDSPRGLSAVSGLSFVLSELALGYMALESPFEAAHVAQRAADVAEDLPVLEAYAKQIVALTRAYGLDLAAAEEEFASAYEIIRGAGFSVPQLFWTLGHTAILTLSSLGAMNSLGTPLRRVVDLLGAYAERMELRSNYLNSESAYNRLELGSLAALYHLKEQLGDSPVDENVTRPVASTMRARLANLAMFAGEYVVASAVLDTGESEVSQAEWNARARLQLLQGDPLGSLQLAWTAHPTFGSGATESSPHLLGSLALFIAGETDQAVTWFNQIVGSATPEVLTVELATVPYEPMRELAELARDLAGVDAVGAVDALPESLRVPYFEALSKAELELAQRLSEGGTVAEAASDLFISYNTAKSHLRRIYRKLEVNSKEEAADVLASRYSL